MSLLGIDLGTTGCKAAVYSDDGRVLASAYREYAVQHPGPGLVELDSRHVFGLVLDVMREVISRSTHDPVAALCISSMGEAFVPVTRDRRILGNSIVASLDLRGGEYLDLLVARIGPEAFYEINPNTLAVTYSLPKLLWLRERQPELYAATDHFLPWGDFVSFMLGARACTSFAQANRTLLFDIRKEAWSERLLTLSGLDGTKLPEPVMSGHLAGTVSDAMAAELGLRKGVAVVVGAHDQCCNALGAGITSAGKAVCGIGTFECLTPVYAGLPDGAAMRAAGLNVEHHVLPGLYVSFIYNQAGSLVRWFRDTFAAADRRLLGTGVDIYETLAAELPREPTRLLTLPYFEPTGAPEFTADAAGVIAGLRTDTSRGAILRSIMEGATFYFVRSIEALKRMHIACDEFIATGGGAKSDAWLQIKADILGVPFVRPQITECGTLGAAILAGVATGAFRSAEDGVGAFVRRERTFEPNAGHYAFYQEQYARYTELFAAVRPVLRRL